MTPRRLGWVIAAAILIGLGINHIYWAVVQWPMGDLQVYLEAARHLQAGLPLYSSDVPSYAAYWYAPWFAAAFVPFTWVPLSVAAVAWASLLVTASALVTWPLIRRPSRSRIALAAFVFPLLFAVSAGGNVQPLLVLALTRGFHGRAGPVWVGVAASLKVTPIVLAVAYLARGEWRRGLLSFAIFAFLLIPGILMGLFTARPAELLGLGLFGVSLPLYLASVAIAVAAIAVVPRRYALLTSALAAVLALPRLFAYDATLLVVGTAEPPAPARTGAGPGA
ncbi:MAG: glycosyltransferase 87 family protein [Chloroflexota bacterium]